MKLVKVKELIGDEILARAVLTEDYQILLAEGTVIKKEYIQKLIELNTKYVYILRKSNLSKQSEEILRIDIKEKYKTKVQEILEKHTYKHNIELMELCKTAENIVDNIVEEDEVIEKIYEIEERGADLYEHSISVCSLSIIMSLKLGYTKEATHDIGVGSILHDLGLRYLPMNIDNCEVETLLDKEKIEYKKHTIYGYSALNSENWISDIAKNIVLCHHEKIDGSGYPLRATDISKESKVVAVCEAFDEMICGMGAKQAKVHEAIEYLKNFRGVYFDADCVDALLTFIAVYPVGTIVKLDTGELAVVMKQNKHFTERPVIKIIEDINGNPVTNGKTINLLETRNIFVTL